VYIDTANNKFIIFQGTSYANHLITDDKDFDASLDSKPSIAYTGANEVVFEQLSGETNQASDIIINLADKTTNVRTDTITINHEGQIKWEH
jgi:hypothetical protein